MVAINDLNAHIVSRHIGKNLLESFKCKY